MPGRADNRSQQSAGAGADVRTPKGGVLVKLPVLVGGVMTIEAVILCGGFWLMHSRPQMATADVIAAAEAKDAASNKTAEVPLVEFKALNRSSGRTFLYDISIYVVVKASAEQRVKEVFHDQQALIEDRVRTIIAESDPEKLGGGSEPGLETLRRQVKYQLDGIVGERSEEH